MHPAVVEEVSALVGVLVLALIMDYCKIYQQSQRPRTQSCETDRVDVVVRRRWWSFASFPGSVLIHL
ncbi:hypothetical protein BJ508DRAFT_411176 [Ascobolus immersus RN42]|uniref:Uncharacterized protein n=1 Tax=Ascobolus immersus RN42 TaxID=1160509 RepID=A0A3N4IQI5_ASCIM|nr:hypothetical protein BJ508DRAFT_411176 [Ascobolus immersus RN42]